MWLLRKKKVQAQTDERQWENSLGWEVWKVRHRATQARAASSGWKWNSKATVHRTKVKPGASGQGPSQPHPGTELWEPVLLLTFRQPWHHPAPSQLHLTFKVPMWSPESFQTHPHVTPKAPLLQQPAGKKGALGRLLECFQNSIKQPCQEGRIFPYFSNKETEARWIFKAIVLECGKGIREPAANVFIICTFPKF